MAPSQRSRDFERRFDKVTTVAAMAVIPVMLIELGAANPGLLQAAWAANWIIWVVFLVDAVLKAYVLGRTWVRSPAGVLSFGIVVVSFPGLGALFGAARLSRLARVGRLGRLARSARLLRVVRLGLVGWRVVTGLSRALDPAAMPFVTLAVLVVLAFGAAAVYFVEFESGGRSMEDAMWWAITTVTTVGYGDIIPQSRGGRLVAVAVMLIGIVFTSLLTAQLAAYITARSHQAEEDALHRQINDLAERIDRLSAKLDDRLG